MIILAATILYLVYLVYKGYHGVLGRKYVLVTLLLLFSGFAESYYLARDFLGLGHRGVTASLFFNSIFLLAGLAAPFLMRIQFYSWKRLHPWIYRGDYGEYRDAGLVGEDVLVYAYENFHDYAKRVFWIVYPLVSIPLFYAVPVSISMDGAGVYVFGLSLIACIVYLYFLHWVGSNIIRDYVEVVRRKTSLRVP